MFLPAYSPELNPCELVFAMVKNALNLGRFNSDLTFERIMKAFASVELVNVAKFYGKCIFPSIILPDLMCR